MKMKLLLFLLIIILFGGCIQHYSNLNDNIKLVSQNDTISEISKAELAMAKANYENSEKLLTHTYWVIDAILIGFFLTIFITIISYYLTTKNIRENLIETISNKINTEIEKLKAIVLKYDHENELIQNYKILILEKNGVELPIYVDLVLQQFKNKTKQNYNSISEIHPDFKYFDIIFYYNEGDKIWTNDWDTSEEQNNLIDFINTKLKGGLIYFGKNLSFDKVANSKKHLISASNFSSQIYGNMLNQMKLLHALKNN